MHPTKFEHVNTTMHAPGCDGKCEAPDCLCVDAYRDEKYVITCWQPTNAERVRIAAGEPIYLIVVGGMLPVTIMVESPFTVNKPAESEERG